MAAGVTTGVVALMLDAADDRKVASSYDEKVLGLLNTAEDDSVVEAFASGDQVEVIDAQNPDQTIDVERLPPPADTEEELAEIAEMRQALEAEVAAMVATGAFATAQSDSERIEQLEAAYVTLFGSDESVQFDVNDFIEFEWSRGITPNAVKAVLQYTSIPLDSFDIMTQGAGSLNAVGAVRLANATNFKAQPGQYWLRAVVTPG
jgi:hypothetical protein